LPERLVTEPSREAPKGSWEPLSTRIGGSGSGAEAPQANDDASDVFFPKPFNDDQLEIIRRLSRADGAGVARIELVPRVAGMIHHDLPFLVFLKNNPMHSTFFGIKW
jgi:hypothetical protein